MTDKIRAFSHIQKLKEFIISKPALQKMLKEARQLEEKTTSWKCGSTEKIKFLINNNHIENYIRIVSYHLHLLKIIKYLYKNNNNLI